MQPILDHTLQFFGGPRPRGAAKVRLSLVIDPADQSVLARDRGAWFKACACTGVVRCENATGTVEVSFFVEGESWKRSGKRLSMSSGNGYD